MLTDLNIQNYAIADLIELEFADGMTAITGETGAGKSITLDALGLALGNRADSAAVGNDGDKAEITASFDISSNTSAQHWLNERELTIDDSCLLRRVIKRDGKSKAFINNRPATVQDLKQLGEMLINIHGQHEHQALLKKDTQRHIIDDFAGAEKSVNEVKQAFTSWQSCRQHLQTLRDNAAENSAKVDFLRYQVKELEELSLTENELTELETEQTLLANAETVIGNCQQVLTLSENETGGLEANLSQTLQLLGKLPTDTPAIAEATELFSNALIQVQEGSASLRHYLDSFDADPSRLQTVEERLSAIYELARKHRVEANAVYSLHETLSAELDNLDCSDEKLAELEQQEADLYQQLLSLCSKLSKKRQTAAKKLQTAVDKQLNSLRMANCQVQFALTELAEPNQYGKESIELLVTTNPAQAPQSLAKIASGGELSRIGLAIQVVTAQTSATPTLIFDEVDSGIGGAVAEVVGKLLRQLGQRTQVFCVTHLPQVACQANQHFVVDKTVSKQKVSTTMLQLTEAERQTEIARMLGGVEITAQTQAHAEELLALAREAAQG